jgi:hypothetical protein
VRVTSIFIESMGVEYNQLGEECKSSKQEKERKFVWVGDPILHIHVFS